MILDFQTRLGQTVRAAAQRAFGTDVALPGLSFQYPPRLELGDLALTAAFDLAKTLRLKPRDAAAKLAGELSQVPGIQRVDVAGAGYLNLFLDRGLFARELTQFLGSDTASPGRGTHVIVEHTSINPNKAAHIGHLRNAVLGDTFVRALRHRGYAVGVQNYIDDTGVQVADVVVGFLHIERQTLAEVAAIPGKFDYYCWDLYARVGEFYAADPSRKALQAETLHAIEAGAGEAARMAAYVAGRIVDAHLKTMARLGIDYDLLAHESDILRLRFWESAFERLKAQGAIRLESEGKSAGCWVLAMEGAANDEDKIIVRSNGTVTYTGKDIAYQRASPVEHHERRRRARCPGVWPCRARLQRDRRRAVLSPTRREGGADGARARGGGGRQPPPGVREGRPVRGHRACHGLPSGGRRHGR